MTHKNSFFGLFLYGSKTRFSKNILCIGIFFVANYLYGHTQVDSVFSTRTPNTELSWHEIHHHVQKLSFVPDGSPNQGFSNEIVWIKVKVAPSKEARYLFIENAHLDYLDIYQLKKGVLIETQKSGDQLDFNNRYFSTNYFNFKIHDSTETIYIRVRSDGILLVPIRIYQPRDIVSVAYSYQRLHYLYFGIIFLTIFIYFTFAIALKESIYFYYALSAIGIGTFTAIDFGYTFQILWPHHPELNRFNIVFYGIFMTSIYFTQRFLEIRKGVWLWLYLILYGISFVAISISFFSYNEAIKIFMVPLYAAPLLIMSSSIYFYFTYRDKATLIFVLGWSVYMCCFIVYALSLSGLYEPNFWIWNMPQIGSCFEIPILGIAVTYKIIQLRLDRDSAQRDLLRIFEEKQEMILNQNRILEEKVTHRTLELNEKNNEIIAQNEELQAQQAELENQHQLLSEKNVIIEEKGRELEYSNQNLEKIIETRTSEILRINQELIDKNIRLEQFSFITAHNLRGPVATLLGLKMLYDTQKHDAQMADYVIVKTAEMVVRLDNIIKGLMYILDLNKSIHAIKETVDLHKTLNDVKVLLSQEINDADAEVHADFKIKSFLTVDIYINSIFLNLISNAIKFRIPNTKPIIEIASYKAEDNVILEFKDNGLGFDMEEVRDKFFGPFKRFHETIPGKGLGMYTVKTQVEMMKGQISVQSSKLKGTQFIISLPMKS